MALLMHFGSKSLSSVYGGVAIGYALLCVLFVVVISRLDWAQLAVEAKARACRVPAVCTVSAFLLAQPPLLLAFLWRTRLLCFCVCSKARVTSKVSAQTSGTSEIEIAREEPQEGVAGDE